MLEKNMIFKREGKPISGKLFLILNTYNHREAKDQIQL